MFRFLISKKFFLNLIIAVILISALIWWVFRFLDNYTLHGESITVPNLSGYTVAELDSFLKEKELRYIVIDSIYDTQAERGVILDQDPKSNSKVKQNRTIYLVVNAMLPPMVKMPDLVDLSLRQAIAMLETCGFKVGELEYIPDIARNAVISQKISIKAGENKEINPGTMIRKGAVIDLVLGDGLSDEKILVPLLIGLTRDEALVVLQSNYLNMGGRKYDESVKTPSDSAEAMVWKQNPDPESDQNMINLGDYVDLWFTLLEDKVEIDTLGIDK
ncbi:MAG: PASTA domain-containing protein [Bacteroidota bacterium]